MRPSLIDLLPLPLIILGCIVVAFVLGMRIGFAVARKFNTRDQLQHDVLSEEYNTLYEDMCYADKLLHDIHRALMEKNSDSICQFVEDFQEWNGMKSDNGKE